MTNHKPRHNTVTKNLKYCPSCNQYDHILPSGVCALCAKSERDRKYRASKKAA